jgi:hypothetical protein
VAGPQPHSDLLRFLSGERSVLDREVVRPTVHDRGLLFLRAVALGWSEGSSSARPFS